MSAKRGFGLIEVMISATILAVAIAGTMSLVAQLDRTYEHERLVTQALHIAEGQMETLLVMYSSDANLIDGAHTGSSFDVHGLPGGSFFAAAWTVTSGVPITNTRQVVVTITWTELGITKKFTLTSVRT